MIVLIVLIVLKSNCSKLKPNCKGNKMTTSTIYRLVVEGKYIDYYTSIKRANLAAREFIAQGKKIEIIEDKLN